MTGGFQVWAGKSSENNDLLTTRHTGKEDLWFHARGVGGSHVVLKVHPGKGEVSRAAVQDAASVAAFYSKMKNASLVPVTMCLGKHVRKPKGASAGTVMVEREETVFAEPRLPADRKDEHAR
ncbi:MAG: NFACT RNA binding domain-containing protein [Bacteroidetes bacterium]|nr:NFACT RNA binding domain-containing protein [Bacteroidota bacterium]